jgi:hypothetical protein
MHRTIDVIVHADGTIEPLEPVVITGARRAFLTILDEPPAPPAPGLAVEPSIAQLLTQLRAEGLLVVPEDLPAEIKPLSHEERAALAQRIPAGTPLSQIISEDREERF